MSALTEELAELMYNSDIPVLPWARCVHEDRSFYLRMSDVMVDHILTHFEQRNQDNIFSSAIAYLSTESDVARLHRS
jgi:hypothetical protein